MSLASRRFLGALGLALSPLLAGAGDAQAQRDSAVVVAGPHYRAGGTQAWLLGDEYRYLWTTPVRVERLDLSRFAGGLTPTERGGGEQTRSLRFRGADGREYAFRSVDKWPNLEDEPAFHGTIVQDIVQDQVSSLHPAGAVVVAELAEAAGILHASPRLLVMPDDPRLGEFRRDFAGMLGQMEERANEPAEGSNGVGFGGFRRITGSERLFERLEESPRDRVDGRAYLRARLFDLVIGDWDRHEGNWRWAGEERGGVTAWRPIPVDRDYAFVDYDGTLLELVRRVSANTVKFQPELENIYGLTLNGQPLDRQLLTELPLEAWDSAALDLQRRLTDPVIDAAVARMPPEYHALSGARVAQRLKARRDDLPDAARRFYRMHATMVDVRGTDERELLDVERRDDGTLAVRLFAAEGGAPARAPYYQRTFRRDETQEVRIYLQGGDDRAVVRGTASSSPVVRVIGGGGDDVYVDSSRVRGKWGQTGFYDDRGENRFEGGPGGTVVDRSEYAPPSTGRPISGQGFRDWGSQWSVRPIVDYRSTEGLIVGGGPQFTQYGFRRVPYAYTVGARGQVALGSGGVALDVTGDFRRVGSQTATLLRFRASQLETLRFYGYGNETALSPRDAAIVPLNQVLLSAALRVPTPLDGHVAFGPIVKFSDPDAAPGTILSLARVLGGERFGQAGALVEGSLDQRDDPLVPQRGFLVRAGSAAYPSAWHVDEPFGDYQAVASAYLSTTRDTLGLALAPTLALRVGGRRLWGDFPVHEAAFLGGTGSVRGYHYQRFAGEALAFGNAELRAPITRAELVLNGHLGGLLLADAGRVWAEGEDSDEWHTAFGGGLWFSFALRATRYAASAVYARGERGVVYLRLGMPF